MTALLSRVLIRLRRAMTAMVAASVGLDGEVRVDLRPLRGESRETQRAVRRAIREGCTDDPRVDLLARKTIGSLPRLRWAKYFFAALLVLSAALLIEHIHETGQVILRSAECALWIGAIALSIVNQRRHDGYRGLTGRP
jgi:hypothetical protein